MPTSFTDPGDIQEFDFSVNLLAALLWQYTNATNLQSLLQSKQNWYTTNQTDFWENWITNVFNLATANQFGLSVWSIILGQPIFINNGPPPAGKPTWGFGQYHKNFNNGNFTYTNGNTYYFQTETARIILQLRYFQLTSAGTVPEINRMLKYVFSDYGLVYLIDGLDMTQRYYFTFPIPSDILLALNSFDLLPRPAGVKSEVYQGSLISWGFGQYHANFTRGNFAN